MKRYEIQQQLTILQSTVCDLNEQIDKSNQRIDNLIKAKFIRESKIETLKEQLATSGKKD
jgi:hypothetical protein